MNKSIDVQSIINIFLNRKKTFFLLIVITAIIAGGISYLIPPKYKTNAVIYPVHLSPYSEESQTEQLLQYINSASVRDVVIKKLNLVKHYGIDINKPDYKSLLIYLYRENISVSPTLYESIDIEVRDKNPEMTKAIAESIIEATDSLIKALKIKIIIEEHANYDREVKTIKQRIDSINKMLVELKIKYNIIDQKSAAKYLSKVQANGKLSGDLLPIAEALKIHQNYMDNLQKEIKESFISLGNLQRERDRLEVDLNGHLHFSQVISPPFVPDKKYFPVRWIIIALSELSIITIYFIYLLIIENRKK